MLVKILLLISAGFLVSVAADCTMTIAQADECAGATMFFGNRNAAPPSSDGEMDAMCDNIRDKIKCLKTYTDTCLTGLPQVVSGQILEKADHDNEQRCTNPEDRKTFLDNMKCFVPKDNGKAEPVHRCADKHIIMTEKIKEFPKMDRVPALCCVWQHIIKCYDDTLKQSCGDDASEYFRSLIGDAEDDTVSMPCADFVSLDACDKKMNPDQWQQLKDLAASDDPAVLAKRHKYHSVVAPLFEMMQDP